MVSLQKLRKMNGERIYFSNQNLNAENQHMVEGTNTHFQNTFKTFLSSFIRDNTRVYHRQITINIQKKKHLINLELADIKAYDEHLYQRFTFNPLDMLKVMENAVRQYVADKKEQFPNATDESWQVVIRSDEFPKRLREITSLMVSKIFVVSGIIISTTKSYIKATKLRIQCRNCSLSKIIEIPPGQNPYVPSFCEGQNGRNQKCPQDSFVAMPNSEVIDCQSLKIQQNAQDVPTGQIARTFSLIADRYNVSVCVPGDRVKITGIMLVSDIKTDNLSKGYLYVTGIQKLKERSNFQYTEQEEEIFKSMSKDPTIYEKIYKCVAPGIFGNEQIKKAIACMLFGGSRKHLPDQTVLRGDINILLIGDPSTAKSQFLKFVEQTASIAVYTSGKGSSAAGLTASITKDSSTGEFQIQGGALVLADGGIVCIDEFDKMKSTDRVAIHEAMEQQTISIAKAGITTRLNSRTSILAAANPIHGRYDAYKDIEEQIELQTTILSRFDCIFIVRDINTDENNNRIATHILNLHQGKLTKEDKNEIPFEILKKYIKYARNKIFPRLSAIASQKLQNIYVADRQKAKSHKLNSQSKQSIPITVRQLEAIIRLSESLARMRLKNEVTVEEVDEAHYLFEISTMKSIEGKEFGFFIPENMAEDVQKIEEAIRKKICIGSLVSTAKLVEEMGMRYNEANIGYAISNMVRKGQFRQIQGKKQLIREREA